MQVVLDEATESYQAAVVKELSSNTINELEQNVRWIADWLKANPVISEDHMQ